MSKLNQIYDCLETDPIVYQTPRDFSLYTPWNLCDKQEYPIIKPRISHLSLKRPRTVSTSSRMRSTRRSDLDSIQKQPIKNNTYIFPLSTPKVSDCELVQSKLSTPIIKQKRNTATQKIDSILERERQREKRFYQSSSHFKTKQLRFYESESCGLFLFKPKITNPIEMRNKNIQLIRNINQKKLFKSEFIHRSKCQ